MKLNLQDSKGMKKPITIYAFFIEDITDLAKRNDCREWKTGKIRSDAADRGQMTLLSIFEYMIGNTDWSVWNNHNIKLLAAKKDSTAKPLPVAYDFDNSGLVNADYAVPDPIMEIESVVERVYRGFPRTPEELGAAIQVFNSKKDKIYELINTFEPLPSGSKKTAISYLNDF